MKKAETTRILLAHNMKRLREALGLSQMALAERVGCSTTLIGNIETLKRFPSAENFDRIAAALEVPVYELFMKDSPAIERALSKFEVRERLEQRVLKAIEEALDEKGHSDQS
ncbi:MAG TPA: helix-turn-helix transcriptional regulator [Rectinemataceae bacterium]|nr:helix-turn-helix transcriptional regulator [Rectinemataceae bacterium]